MVPRLLIVLLAATLTTEAREQAPSTVSTVIEVVNDTGAMLPGAYVIIHWEAVDTTGVATNVGIREDRVGRTDREGRFATELPEGFYDVFVAYPVASPHSKKIRVESGKPVLHKAVLQFEPLLIPVVFHPPVR
jgi:hypothetical protein